MISEEVVSFVVFVVGRGIRDGCGLSGIGNWCEGLGRFKIFDTGVDVSKEEVG